MSTHRRAGSAQTTIAILAALVAFAEPALAQTDDDKNHYILECDGWCNPRVAVDAAIGSPTSVTIDATGNVYFASQHVVFKLDRAGQLFRVAGTGRPGYSGDGGPATAARLDMPEGFDWIDDWESYSYRPTAGLAVDPVGTIYIADFQNHRIRRVDAGGTMSTLTDHEGEPIDGRPEGLAIAPDGALWFTGAARAIHRRLDDGTVEPATAEACDTWTHGTCNSRQIAFDRNGALIFPDWNCRVLRWAPPYGAAMIAGHMHKWGARCERSDDGYPALGQALFYPSAVAVDGENRVYIADTFNHCVRRIDHAGIIEAVAGTCGHGGERVRDGDRATSTTLDEPLGVAVAPDGSLYIADYGNRRIRKVGTDGNISTVAGNGEALP